MEYTSEQSQDITQRQEEVIAFMKEKQLKPAIQMSMNNLGNDNFAIRPVVFLIDLKYVETPITPPTTAQDVLDLPVTDEAVIKEAPK